MIARALATAARLLSGAEVRWTGCLPDTRRRLYYANHSSHLDFPVLWSALPPPVRRLTRPIAAREYWQAGPVRRLLAGRVFNAVLVERGRRTGGADQVEQILATAGEYASLIIFPEGTRGSSGEVAPFHGGLYRLARLQPELELVPVYLDGLARVLPKGALLPVPLRSSVTFGRPLHLGADECKAAFQQRARAALVELKP